MVGLGALGRKLRRALAGEPAIRRGNTSVADARRLADATAAAGDDPAGCVRLDAQTVDDLDLPLVFGAIDRTTTPLGAQALWRWLVNPASSLDVLAARERKLASLTDARVRDSIAREMPDSLDVDAHVLPRLLWDRTTPPPASPVAMILVLALIGCLVLGASSPTFIVGAAVLVIATIVFDMIAQRELAEQAHALVVLGSALDSTTRLAYRASLPPELLGDIRALLAVRAALHKRLLWLTVRDPFDLFELLRSVFLVRVFAVRSCMRIVEARRAELRRIVLWLGELDALAAIAVLRTERTDLRVPALDAAESEIAAHALVHPVIENAVGNDLALRSGLLITGSNASGKSTFLRTVGVNAVLAQSIHTTFGGWRAPLLTVRTAMRINDDLGRGLSTYAAEVESVGTLVKAVTTPDVPRPLTLLDEPFHGTNPAVRVPIVVAVLEYLASHGLVMAATHDLDVARLVSDAYTRGYFSERPDGGFDRTLRNGIAPSTNAVELLARAGYPQELLARIAATPS